MCLVKPCRFDKEGRPPLDSGLKLQQICAEEDRNTEWFADAGDQEYVDGATVSFSLFRAMNFALSSVGDASPAPLPHAARAHPHPPICCARTCAAPLYRVHPVRT